MKKTRICAALLSIIMTATAFPAFQASAASAEEPVNLFDTATASVTVEERKNNPSGMSENEYLHLYNRISTGGPAVNEEGLIFSYTVTDAEKLNMLAQKEIYIEFNARFSNIFDTTTGATNTHSYERLSFGSRWNGADIRQLGSAPGNSSDGGTILSEGMWTKVTHKPVTKATNGNIYFHLIKSSWTIDKNPTDFDDFCVYYLEGTEKRYIIEPIGDNFADYIATGVFSASGQAKVMPQREDTYERIAVPTSGNTTVTYTLSEPAVPGYYVLGGSTRMSVYTPVSRGGNNNGKIIVTTDNGTELASYNISTEWSSFETAVKFEEDVNSITITADNAKGLDFYNLSLTLEQASNITLDDEESFLDGSVRSASNIIEDIAVTDYADIELENNSYVTVYDRPYAHWTMFSVATNQAGVVGRTYYFSFDIRASADCEKNGVPQNGCVRLSATNMTSAETGAATLEITSGTTGNYYRSGTTWLVDYGTEWVHVDAKATVATGNQWPMNFSLVRGMSSDFHHPSDIDNIKVWYYDDNGSEVVLNEKNFEGSYNLEGIGIDSYAKMAVQTDYAYSRVLDKDGVQTYLNYSFDDVSLGAGYYRLNAEVRVPYFCIGNAANGDIIDNEFELSMSYTLDNGKTKNGNSFTLTHMWSPVNIIVKVPEGAKLSDITMTLDTDLPLDFRNIRLSGNTEKDGGVPNVGILMMLLHKKEGGVKTVKETVEYVYNGSFDEPFDFSKVTNTYNGLPANTWMNHSNYASKMETVNIDGNNVLSVSGIQTNWNGIAYGLGELQPGDYTMKVNVKLANASDSCHMRVSVNSANNMDTYIASKNEELHTITGEKWTKIEFKFTVKEPTNATVRIRGGMSGAPDTVPYYVDDLSVTTEVTRLLTAEEASAN